ncbi:MAG: hypothetical protein RMM17_00385 [Acidobacteriota bacterium]|nr:hypothetical protein [Blastocatellia bacterium]MDW8411123.1 hypothetical protein [Acidobacteriota bacterium]
MRYLLLLLLVSVAYAQDYDIQRFDVSVRLNTVANTAQVRAQIQVKNVTTQGRSGQSITFKINKDVRVEIASVDGAEAVYRQKADERLPELVNLTIDFPRALAPAATAVVALSYSLELKESTALATISPNEVLLLPESFWIPLVHTPFVIYGPDYAPVKLTVGSTDGLKVVSDGRRVDATTYEQELLAQPVLIAGDYDEPFELTAGGVSCEFVLPKGILPLARKQAEAIATEVASIAAFYSKILEFRPDRLRIVSCSRVGSQVIGTTLVLNEDLFRREELDIETIEFIARAMLRQIIGATTVLRGRGWYVLYDALPVHLAGLYFEDRYGKDAGREFFARRARAYAPVAAARTDGPLLFLSMLDAQYANSMLNKGALMLRLLQRRIGSDKLLGIYRTLFAAKLARFDDFKNACLAIDKSLAGFFDQWFEKVVEPDFVIGIPFEVNGIWKCALRNFGQGEAQVEVLAVDESGTRHVQTVLLPSQGRTEVTFGSKKIVSVEVDPDKLYPQTNYDNDTRPQVKSAYTLFNEANVDFNRKEYAEAERKLREAIEREAYNTVPRAMLLRVLTATGRYDEAAKGAAELRKFAPLPIYTITWMNYVLGEIALAANKPNEAAERFFAAVAAGRDNVPARQKLIEAERRAGRIMTGDDSVKAFLQQFDRAIKEATVQALEPLINRSNLSKFARSVAANKPQSWITEAVRVEQVTADKLYVDVVITAESFDKRQQSGSGLLVLRRRRDSSWILDDVNLFSVQ